MLLHVAYQYFHQNGDTALRQARKRGNKKIVQFLLENGAIDDDQVSVPVPVPVSVSVSESVDGRAAEAAAGRCATVASVTAPTQSVEEGESNDNEAMKLHKTADEKVIGASATSTSTSPVAAASAALSDNSVTAETIELQFGDR